MATMARNMVDEPPITNGMADGGLKSNLHLCSRQREREIFGIAAEGVGHVSPGLIYVLRKLIAIN